MEEEILSLVFKPSRYLAGEVNSISKDLSKIAIKVALCFPEVYEIGMSHLGLSILYHILNQQPHIAAERVYAPQVDLERILRERKIPLSSLESSLPLKDFDIVGFSLQSELTYTNILNMLELASIPLYSKERGNNFPLIIGGGPCAFNPEPVADFFDAFVIGEGEEIILEICEAFIRWKKRSFSKKALLEALSEIEGIYVPSFIEVSYHSWGTIKEISPLKRGYTKVKKRCVKDLDKVDFPTKPVVPFTKIVHDRLILEIARGCTRGCRFCQAGIIYRPPRERSIQKIKEIAEISLRETGYDEISLLSLSTGDYSCIQDLLMELTLSYSKEKIAISLPSLRVGSLDTKLIGEIKKVRKTGFTLAPEAGTQRLRDVINKGITEDEILTTITNVFSAGWNSLKLYFMIGLPTEKEEDIQGIVDISKKAFSLSKKDIKFSISTFVPKPHTPFQWLEQISLEEILVRQGFLKRRLPGSIKWQDPYVSMVEGALARGDRRLSKVLVTAHNLGCRFDGWSEHFDYELWKKAFKLCNLEIDFYQRKRDLGEILPWSYIDSKVERDFLFREYQRALQGLLTPDCRTTECLKCGICEDKKIRILPKEFSQRSLQGSTFTISAPLLISKFRLRFQKIDKARFLSHLELVTTFLRAIRRARIPVRYSEGFHPLPKVSFAPALAVGIESLDEYIEVKTENWFPPSEMMERLNRALPLGIRIVECKPIPLKSIPPQPKILRYMVKGYNPLQIEREKIQRFLQRKEFWVKIKKKERVEEVNLRALVDHLHLNQDLSLEMHLKVGGKGQVRPQEAIAHILELKEEEVRCLRILKLLS